MGRCGVEIITAIFLNRISFWDTSVSKPVWRDTLVCRQILKYLIKFIKQYYLGLFTLTCGARAKVRPSLNDSRDLTFEPTSLTMMSFKSCISVESKTMLGLFVATLVLEEMTKMWGPLWNLSCPNELPGLGHQEGPWGFQIPNKHKIKPLNHWLVYNDILRAGFSS